MSSQTQQFYEQNSHDLIVQYDSADMSALHQLLAKHTRLNSTIIDIGFGSGRDLAYLQSNGHDIYGIDPVEAFVIQAQHRFADIREHFRVGSFLTANIPSDWLTSFDTVISIAVWMHLKAHERPKAIDNYKWKEDKDGNSLEEPVKFQDHLLDSVRYCAFTNEIRSSKAITKPKVLSNLMDSIESLPLMDID